MTLWESLYMRKWAIAFVKPCAQICGYGWAAATGWDVVRACDWIAHVFQQNLVGVGAWVSI